MTFLLEETNDSTGEDERQGKENWNGMEKPVLGSGCCVRSFCSQIANVDEELCVIAPIALIVKKASLFELW